MKISQHNASMPKKQFHTQEKHNIVSDYLMQP